MALLNLESLINTPSCLLSKKSRCVDLILTNKQSLFKNSKPLEVGISIILYFKIFLVLTSLRCQYIQGNPKTKYYRDCKSFNFQSFNNEFNELLKSEKYINYSLFKNIFSFNIIETSIYSG